MRFDQPAPILAVADTTRPILLIVFVVGLFAIAGLGVFFGRKHVSAQNARALSDDTGLAKGAVKGGDGTFSTDWLAEAREDVDDTPRQSFAEMLTLQGVGEVTDTGPSPFGATTVADDPALPFDAASTTYAPAPAAYTAPSYPVEAAPATQPAEYESSFDTAVAEAATYEAAAIPTYETPTYETPTYETAPAHEAPAFEAPAYEPPAFEVPAVQTYEAATYEMPAAPTYDTPANQSAHTEPAYTEPAYTEPAYTEPAYTEPAYTEPVAAETVVEPSFTETPAYESAYDSAPVYSDPLPVPPTTTPAAPAAPAAPGEEYATFFGATPPPPPPPPVEPFNIWAEDPDQP